MPLQHCLALSISKTKLQAEIPATTSFNVVAINSLAFSSNVQFLRFPLRGSKAVSVKGYLSHVEGDEMVVQFLYLLLASQH